MYIILFVVTLNILFIKHTYFTFFRLH